jgi:hypothetical protein
MCNFINGGGGGSFIIRMSDYNQYARAGGLLGV